MRSCEVENDAFIGRECGHAHMSLGVGGGFFLLLLFLLLLFSRLSRQPVPGSESGVGWMCIKLRKLDLFAFGVAVGR